jgi:AcrR family transcriptional regulator
MSAEERRESVIKAAIAEFARGGYHGTSTETIARRVGVSQPYLFRLFANKQAIFLAAGLRCIEKTRAVMADAAQRSRDVDEPWPGYAMAAAYRELIEDRDQLLMQMQMYVAVGSLELAGETDVAETIRAAWADLWDTISAALDSDVNATTSFMAQGMLINVLVALGFPQGHRFWTGHDTDSWAGYRTTSD